MTWKPRWKVERKSAKHVKNDCIARDLSFQSVPDMFAEVISHLGLNKGRNTKLWSCFHGFHLGSKVHPEAHSKFNHKHQFQQWKLHDYIKYHNCYIHRIYHFSHFHRDIVYIYDLYQFHHYGHLLGRFWLHLGGGLKSCLKKLILNCVNCSLLLQMSRFVSHMAGGVSGVGLRTCEWRPGPWTATAKLGTSSRGGRILYHGASAMWGPMICRTTQNR